MKRDKNDTKVAVAVIIVAESPYHHLVLCSVSISLPGGANLGSFNFLIYFNSLYHQSVEDPYHEKWQNVVDARKFDDVGTKHMAPYG